MTKDDGWTKVSSLQKTILIMSAVCEMLSICIISSNISKYSEDRIFVYNGILILSLIIIIIWIMVFFGAIYKLRPIIYVACILWTLIAFLWLFFISGCISPTRCPEGLWLIENDGREGVPVISNFDFYYHEYHFSFTDKRPKKTDPEPDMKTFDEIMYPVNYVPWMKFNGFYTPWSSLMGAFMYMMSFSLVFIFFTFTSVTLWRYCRELDSQQMTDDSKRTWYWHQGSALIHCARVSETSGDFVSQAIPQEPFHTPVVDHCGTATHSRNHERPRRQPHVSCSPDIYETLELFQPQANNGRTCDERPRLLTRIGRYFCRRITNK